MEKNQQETNKKLEIKIEKLEKEISQLNTQLKLIEDWKKCAEFYAEKFQLAYKGYLITQGISESEAEGRSLSVLEKINSLK